MGKEMTAMEKSYDDISDDEFDSKDENVDNSDKAQK